MFVFFVSCCCLLRFPPGEHHHPSRLCFRQVILAVHWFEDGQSDEKLREVMWRGVAPESNGNQSEAMAAWKGALQSDLLEIQDPSNVAQQLCRILIQIVSPFLIVPGTPSETYPILDALTVGKCACSCL